MIKDPSGPGIEKPRTNNYISDPVKTKVTVPDPVTSESTPTPAAHSSRKDPIEATNTLKQTGNKASIELHIPSNPPQPALFPAEESKPSTLHRKSILQTEQEINLLVKDSLQGIYARAIALEAI